MRRNWITILCSVFLVGIINNSIAEETKKITCTGRVIDYNARPVEEATVVCYKFSHGQNQNSYDPLERVQTTSDGRFSFQMEKENSFRLLVAGKQGLALGWREIDNVSEFIIRLGKPSLFKGTVVDEIGRPVWGAKVRICLRNKMIARDEIAPLLPEIWFTTKTNTQGQFLFDNVPKGTTADFGVEAPGKASLWTICDFGPRQGEQFTAEHTDIRIVLPPEACIYGRVVEEATGKPVTGVLVLAMPYSPVGWNFCKDPVQTDPNGRFELTGLAPNKYLLRVISDKEGSGNLTVTVEPGQTVRDVRVPLSKGVPFEVMVYDSEKEEPLEDANVTVTQKEATSRYTTFSQRVTTDANGLARLRVPLGECKVQAFKASHGGTFPSQSVQLKRGQTLRHEVSLPRMACTLSGEVLDEQGRVLSGASVMHLTFGYHILADANGQFEHSTYVTPLPSKVPVLVRHTPSGLGAVGVLRDPTKSGRFHGRIILKPAYELTGRVIDPNGRSIPVAYVKLLMGRQSRLVTEVATDANGVYCIRSVPPPGDNLKDGYAIAACAEGFGLTQVSQIPFHDDTARPVHVDPVVLLPADQVISGVVEDSNDQPVAGVLVEVYGPRLSRTVSQPPCGKTLTDAQGRFRIAGVCKEPLRIYARSPLPQQQSGETWVHGGNENVRVVLGQKLIFSTSLRGKPLPGLKDLKVDLLPADVSNKMILVCFWDMEQRPSRNCIMRLAKQAEQLKQRGVTIVAIQASKIGENKLNQWLKKYNVPFPVGIVQGDVEKTRFDWGVKSLPWLILTNWEQTVITEGFGIDELDEKLKKNIDDTEHAIQKNKATPTKPVAQTGLSDPAKSFLDAEAILAGWESSYAGIRTMRVSYYCTRLVDYQPPANNPGIDMTDLVKYQHVERVEDGKRFHIRFSKAEDGFDRPESLTEHTFDGKITREYSAREKHGSIVAGQLCHVVEVVLPGKDHKGIPRQIKQVFWMAHDKGMCLMKYQWYWDNTLDREIEVEQIAMAKMDSTDVWYPKKAYRTIFSDEFGTTKYELTVTEFIPNVEVDEKTFRFDFPKGTYVFDRVRGIAGVDLPKEPPSLLGKPLPQLKDFNLKLDADKTKDKMILVCFFDMNQRPSRNCIMRLTKQAEQLKQRGVTIVAIQASKIDENKLNEWVKKYNIPFPVGIIQGDVEKTRFDWGVKSLPWLILIDRKHIVRAEGFNIDELDERLGQITGTEPVMENNESTGPKLRTVRFPMSRSVGRLYVGELRLLDPHWWMGWQDAGPARGDVKVPVDKALRLDVTKEGLKELSALAACKPDDIQVVSFSYADVDDAGLGHLARLTGLKMLVSPRVGDTGLAHISKLTSLISLILRHGTFTDDGLKYISNLSSLQRLDLGYTEVTDVGLVHLRGLSSLRYLGLDYNKSVSDAGFVHLRSLNSLERMTLYGTNITGSGFSHLEGISSLREILLNHSAITDEGLGDIAKLKSLEKLSLFNTKISDVGIVHLQALGSLRELSLSGTSVSDAGLDYIGRLTSLESLDLPDWTTDAGLLKLKGLKGLKQLDLGGTQMTGIGLEPLKAFELLESLRLPRGVSDKDLAIIKEFTLLEELSIHNSPITDVGMGYLRALKSLRKLTLSNVEVTDVGYAKLGELSNLEDLTILANRNRQEYAIGDQGLAGVAKLKGLKILALRAPNLTDAGFKHLGKLRSLQEMELKEIKITDAGFVHIGRLRSLRRLWLPSSDICDAGLRHLAELNSLQDLSLQFSGGNTAGLLHLKSLRSLNQLIVSGVTFTEDSLQHLKEISPGLRSVHIGTEGISEEDAKRIEQQVPNCSIIVFAPLSIRRPLPPKPIPPHALVGKALPKFVGINIDFGPSQARDRMILVCFWDMQQRPSRNCLRRLSKRAQELKAKDIVVVAVQSSQIFENKLNEWIKKYNIPFTFGMVQSDEEKTKFDWGVKSLPWLILTNWEQTVIAEGFGIDELDEELKKNIDTEHAIQKNKATPAKLAAQTYESGPPKSFLNAAEILKAWENSYAHFKSMQVSYTHRVLEVRPPAENPHRYDNMVMVMHVERVEQGNRFNIRYSTADDGFAQPDSIRMGAFDGKITREYTAAEKSGMIIRGMIGRNTETMNRLKTYMRLSRRLLTKRKASGPYKIYWIEDPNSKPELSRTLGSAILGSVASVLPELESVAGQMCHVMEIAYNKSRKIWFAHEKGMLPLKYQRYENNELVFEVEQIVSVETDKGDVWYPQKAYLTTDSQDAGRVKYELTTHAFVPNVKVDDNTFRFDFPKGTYVFDRVRGIAGIDLPKEPPSLLGKPLPQLKDFNLKLDADKTKDKMILVCFWDMNQRPSRNCIRELAKRAEELKEKGVAVIAVQASEVDENELNEWVKKYNIPFPVGMVQSDVEKTRFAWGVRSLPWLILTDLEHIVRSNGFSLAELDGKIQAAEKLMK